MTYNVCWKNDGQYDGNNVGQPINDDNNNKIGTIYCVEKDYVYAQIDEDFYLKHFAKGKSISMSIDKKEC